VVSESIGIIYRELGRVNSKGESAIGADIEAHTHPHQNIDAAHKIGYNGSCLNDELK
jgi:hypothetical protein